jgi:hypothetical protein
LPDVGGGDGVADGDAGGLGDGLAVGADLDLGEGGDVADRVDEHHAAVAAVDADLAAGGGVVRSDTPQIRPAAVAWATVMLLLPSAVCPVAGDGEEPLAGDGGGAVPGEVLAGLVDARCSRWPSQASFTGVGVP